jgi:hypothetical protein
MPDGNYSEDWRTLCELASKEQDPKKLMRLLQKLSEALDRQVVGGAQSMTNSALE